MHVALICIDKPGSLEIRQANRPDHVTYLKATDAVEQAGPLLDADGQMCGSLIILDVPDIATAQSWAEGDPYAKAGLFQSVTLQHWNRVIGP
ncbi:YciI family protein [Actibacterium sp. 188UL27-1]|uniref:YciI family protein n=1 Tax=Actibacterium sp. 188UL27-1 TaxID=2786961 RepID=UPI0019560C88|nr:YciI family protein [Actibacterium sp. 188UL27-1]MBM7067217.1 YciI family protein [Actibacterium sp. 188UL27-1]